MSLHDTLRAAGFTGRTLDCAQLLLKAQPLIEQMEFGRLTLHIGSNKVELYMDRRVGVGRWNEQQT